VIEVEVNVLFYTDVNTRGKRTDAIYAVCVIYGEIFFFILIKCILITLYPMLLQVVFHCHACVIVMILCPYVTK
jgi:tetrahydromethanopterin S-methyltransferase subunit B